MDIAALSMIMSQSKAQTAASIAVMNNAKFTKAVESFLACTIRYHWKY